MNPSNVVAFPVPKALANTCSDDAESRTWLTQLPQAVAELTRRWCLTLHAPIDNPDVTASWVVPVTCRDGSRAVLKLGLPHFEGAHEIDGLQFWNGHAMVRLLESDAQLNAMLLERCTPGTPLRLLPEDEQDTVIAGLLRELWLTPPKAPFRPLCELLEFWVQCANEQAALWPDPILVREGLALLMQLSRDSTPVVTLHTDLHAGNVLRAERSPWLAIDPKPFVGDCTYDATQHLLNCPERMRVAPRETITQLADLLGLERQRLQLWTFARAAAQPRGHWNGDPWLDIARSIAP